MIHPSTPGAGDREGGEPSPTARGAGTRQKERPILFSAPMVRAILEGRKTQTRRIVKHKPGFPYLNGNEEDGARWMEHGPCPYGYPGDQLWVRETWMENHSGEEINGHGQPLYRASWGNTPEGQRWRPSIHMPRWASRLTLEVTGVRVERLQDITEADAKAEGAPEICDICGNPPEDEVHWACEADYTPEISHREGFRRLWESINGAGSWDANPWVWVVEFKANSARSAPEASSPKGPLPATPEVTP